VDTGFPKDHAQQIDARAEIHAMISAPATRAWPAIVLKGSGSDMKTNINARKKQRFPVKPLNSRHGAY